MERDPISEIVFKISFFITLYGAKCVS